MVSALDEEFEWNQGWKWSSANLRFRVRNAVDSSISTFSDWVKLMTPVFKITTPKALTVNDVFMTTIECPVTLFERVDVRE